MRRILTYIADREGKVAGELVLEGDVPLLNESRFDYFGPDAKAAARLAVRDGSRDSGRDGVSEEPVVVDSERVVNERRIHGQTAIGSGAFEIVEDSVCGPENRPPVKLGR